MDFLRFLKYNNAVPIAISIVLLGAGATFAATEPEAVYSSEEQVISIDNTYLAQKDLAGYTPKIQITAVTEDEEAYFASYTFYTIDLQDSVWQDISRDERMEVSKADLGQYRDLGVYLTEKMKDIIARDLQRLKDTQKDVRAHVTQKVVATEYGGLIGKFLDATTVELPGYVPVVEEQKIVVVESSPASMPGNAVESPPSATPATATQENVSENAPVETTPAPSVSAPAPVLKVLGTNPAEIPTGATYSDMGAVIVGTQINLGVHVFLDDVEVPQVSLDTSVVGEHTITYKATNQEGVTGSVSRSVRIYDPYAAPVQ